MRDRRDRPARFLDIQAAQSADDLSLRRKAFHRAFFAGYMRGESHIAEIINPASPDPDSIKLAAARRGIARTYHARDPAQSIGFKGAHAESDVILTGSVNAFIGR